VEQRPGVEDRLCGVTGDQPKQVLRGERRCAKAVFMKPALALIVKLGSKLPVAMPIWALQ
jgi:hypothetical protein